VVPAGFFRRAETVQETGAPYGTGDREVERLAMEKVMETERRLGCIPRDVSNENRGYDIESRDPQTGKLRFLEVKGRQEDATTVTITKNEILNALNQPEAYRLCIVLVSRSGERQLHYIPKPFTQEPEFGTASVTYKLSELLTRAAAEPI